MKNIIRDSFFYWTNLNTFRCAAYIITAVVFLPTTTFAQTTPTVADLLSLLASLQSQLAALQLQHNTNTSGTIVLTRSLGLGSTGADVSALQIHLKSTGHYTYPEITGYYGNATAQAVAVFQKANGLEPVGSIGPKTRALLNAQIGYSPPTTSKPPASTNVGVLSRPLSLGSRGTDVSTLQTFLQSKGYYTYPEITGFYGPATVQAVIAFQRANGLEPVGWTGPRTRALLNHIQSSSSTGTSGDNGTGGTIGDIVGGGSFGGGGGTGGGAPPPAPTLTFSANVNSVVAGGNVTLTWRSTNAGSCTASGAWSGSKAESGSQTFANLTVGISTYTLTCTGAGGSTNQTVNVTVTPLITPLDTTPPTISNAAPSGTLPAGTTTTSLTVTTNESAMCAYSSNASATFTTMTPFPTTGGMNHVAPLTGLTNGTSYTYYVLCKDPAGNISTKTTVAFSIATPVVPVPTVTISANPATVAYGNSSTITWSSTNATTCTATGGWTGTQPTTGSQIFTTLTTNQTYTLQCSGAGGSNTQSVSVTVTGSAPDTTPPSAPSGLSGAAISSSQINLTWTASTDNVGVTGYRIFRNGVQVGTPTNTSYSDTGLTASTAYTYTVQATDAAGNLSALSSSVVITTLPVTTLSGTTYYTDLGFKQGFRLFAPGRATTTIVREFRLAGPSVAPVWKIGQWNSRIGASFVTVTPQTLSDGGIRITNKSEAVTVYPTRGVNQPDIRLALNGKMEYGTRGRDPSESFWPALYLSNPAPPQNELAWINSLDHIYITLEARLTKADTYPMTNPNPTVQTALINVFTNVQNRNMESPGFGDYIWFGTPIYDIRYRMKPKSGLGDPGTGKYIYVPPQTYFTSQSVHDRQWVRYNRVDILPEMKKALTEAWSKRFLKGSRNINDYALGNMNLGWEVSGAFDVEMEIRNLAVEVVPRSISTADVTPPIISNPAPTGTLPSGTTTTSLTVTTNESAMCAYSSNASATFTTMTPFPTTGGMNHVAPLTGLTNGTSYTYYILCKDPAGNISTKTTVAFSIATPVVPVPTVTISANPTTVPWGNSSTITWSSTNATACTATGGWTGTKATSGSQTFTSLTNNQTYTLQCSGAGGSATQSVSVTVTGSPPDTTPPSAPSGLSGTAVSSSQINLTWTASTDAVGVTGYKIFRNSTQVGTSAIPSYSDTGLTASTAYTYTVQATDAAGNLSALSNSVVITTLSLTVPTVSIIANPTSITSGGSSILTWSSTNVTSCTASGGWSGSKATSGSESTGPLTASKTYTLTCTGAGGSANASVSVSNVITLLDLVSELRPTSATSILPIYTDTILSDVATACVMKYSNVFTTAHPHSPFDPTEFVTPTPINPTPTLRQAFSATPWALTSWVKNRQYPNLCSSITSNPSFNTVINSQNGGAILKTVRVGTTNVPISVGFYQNRFVFGHRSLDFWESVFGSPLFRIRNDLNVSWPNHFIIKRMFKEDNNLLWMNQYQSLQFIFDAELSYANVNTLRVPLPPNGILPPGAQLEYDPVKHATQFRLSLSLQYRITDAQRASCATATPDPVCGHLEYNGKYMHFSIMIHDERFQYFSLWSHGANPFMYDPGTNSMIYRVSLESFMDSNQKSQWFSLQKQNPYKLQGNRFVINHDIYPLITKAILDTYSQTIIDSVTNAVIRALPNRLPVSGPGGLETDSKYLSHFVLSGANLGYEVTGLSQVVYTIYDFKLLAK